MAFTALLPQLGWQHLFYVSLIATTRIPIIDRTVSELALNLLGILGTNLVTYSFNAMARGRRKKIDVDPQKALEKLLTITRTAIRALEKEIETTKYALDNRERLTELHAKKTALQALLEDYEKQVNPLMDLSDFAMIEHAP